MEVEVCPPTATLSVGFCGRDSRSYLPAQAGLGGGGVSLFQGGVPVPVLHGRLPPSTLERIQWWMNTNTKLSHS